MNFQCYNTNVMCKFNIIDGYYVCMHVSVCVCMTYKRLTLTTAKMAEVVKRKIIPPWVKNLKLSHGKSSCDFTNSRVPYTNQPAKKIKHTKTRQANYIGFQNTVNVPTKSTTLSSRQQLKCGPPTCQTRVMYLVYAQNIQIIE